ncbi:MAG TPA: photosystem I reaction center subunit XII [Ghiorsea sp.]|nr:photosystem I reaction center subunit XII [Ghiorsea sp.]
MAIAAFATALAINLATSLYNI